MVDKITATRFVFDSLYKRYVDKTKKLKIKYLILFCGIPRSGKTFTANFLMKTDYFIRISSDDIKNFLRMKKIKFKSADIFLIQHTIIKYFLKKGFSATSDSNSDQVSYRNKLKAIAKRNNARYLVLFFPTRIDLSIKRYIKNKGITNCKRIHLIKNMIKRYARDLSKPKGAIVINHWVSKDHTINTLKHELIQYDKTFYNLFKGNKKS